MKRLVMGFMGCILLFSSLSYAIQQPVDAFNRYLDKTFELFRTYNNPDNSTEYRMEFEHKLVDLAKDIFAFDVMSRMVIGRYWREFSKSEQEEFKGLFIELLAQNYFDKILQHVHDIKSYPRENIKVLKQILFSKRKAELRTEIKYKDKYVPVNYRFVFIGNRWKIYDVYVEGVSLIKNYRSQFRDLLLKKSPKEVIEELKIKLKKN